MSILRPFLSRVVRRGRLTIVATDGSEKDFGTPAPGFPEVDVRFVSGKAMRRVILDPRHGAAEAFMAGDLRIERGEIMERSDERRVGKECVRTCISRWAQ